jgi:hypothetical protein
MLCFISSVFTFKATALRTTATALIKGSGAIYSYPMHAARILHVFHLHTSIPETAALRWQHVFHLHYDVRIPETAALRRQHVFHLHYDVSSAIIPALLINARILHFTCITARPKYLRC